MAKVSIFTDGAARGNPGPGGYGIVLLSGAYRKELSGAYKLTTNNRMELLAVIIGLESIKGANHDIYIYSDSKYVVDAINLRWLNKWLANGFKGKKNQDLWLRYYQIASIHKHKMIWVKGHANNKENNRCDELATQAADKGPHQTDYFFEDYHNKSLTLK